MGSGAGGLLLFTAGGRADVDDGVAGVVKVGFQEHAGTSHLQDQVRFHGLLLRKYNSI